MTTITTTTTTTATAQELRIVTQFGVSGDWIAGRDLFGSPDMIAAVLGITPKQVEFCLARGFAHTARGPITRTRRNIVTEVPPLYWSEAGAVCCGRHAPVRGSDTWVRDGWQVMTPAARGAWRQELKSSPRCEVCNYSPEGVA